MDEQIMIFISIYIHTVEYSSVTKKRKEQTTDIHNSADENQNSHTEQKR